MCFVMVGKALKICSYRPIKEGVWEGEGGEAVDCLAYGVSERHRCSEQPAAAQNLLRMVSNNRRRRSRAMNFLCRFRHRVHGTGEAFFFFFFFFLRRAVLWYCHRMKERKKKKRKKKKERKKVRSWILKSRQVELHIQDFKTQVIKSK